MSLLKKFATSVMVLTPRQVGTTSHGNVDYTYDAELVHQVLVNKPGTQDVIEADALTNGSSIEFTLAFPKTWNKPLKGAFIVIPNLSGEQRYKVVGDPKPIPTQNCPTAWNYKVQVMAYE